MARSSGSSTPQVKARPRGGMERVIEFCRTRRFGVLSLGFLGIAGLALVLSGPPEEELPARIEIPRGAAVQAPDIPVFDEVAAMTEAERTTAPVPPSRKEAKVSKAAPALAGPGLLTRPRALSITPGALAKAVLLTGASSGSVKAKLVEPLSVGGEILLEAGSVLLGTGQSSEERLFIRFDKALFADGALEKIQAEAADLSDKIPGLKGSRVGHRTARLAGSVGLNFVSGLTDGLQEKKVSGGTVINEASVKNALLNGSSRAALDQSRDMMASLKNDPVVIEVPEGTSFFVLFGKEGG